MTDLRKEFLRAKLRNLPAEPPMPLNHPPDLSILPEDPDEPTEALDELPHSPVTDDSSSASSASSTSTIRPSAFSRPSQSVSPLSTPYPPDPNTDTLPSPRPRRKPLYEPIPWNIHFSYSHHLTTPDSLSTFHIYITPPTSSGPLFVTHHGAGSSGLSFALLASEIRKLLPSAGVLSFDCRGHGETSTPDDGDLSLTTLSDDMTTVIRLTATQYGWEQQHMPDMVLVGHSLGGAVVVDFAKRGEFKKNVLGYAVIDVVEGSAIDALQSMQTYLSSRPSGFVSLEQGIEWHSRSRTIRNPTSARISVPALLQETHDGSPKPWGWRTDLGATQPFWEGWFIGLSGKFLSAPGGKLLILAGTDRLDKELMIGQMQGKYQLIVMPEAGHFVHEDAPEKTAAALVEFFKRNDRSALVLPPKFTAVKRE